MGTGLMPTGLELEGDAAHVNTSSRADNLMVCPLQL